jgi:hypothetical protein
MNKQRIAIHGVPRSGTTWLGEIINSSPNVRYKYQPLFSYELKGFLNANSSLSEIDKFFYHLDEIESPFLDQEKGKEQGIIPVFTKDIITHIAYKEVRYHHLLKNLLSKDSEIKVVGIIRNPLATINSWINSPREFRKDLGWTDVDQWRFADKKNANKVEEFNGFERWKEVALLFHELENTYPNRFLTISYSQLIKSTFNETKRLFDFCNLEIKSQTIKFIDDSREIDKNTTYSVYKKKIHDDDWINKLNKEIIAGVIQEIENTELKKYL